MARLYYPILFSVVLSAEIWCIKFDERRPTPENSINFYFFIMKNSKSGSSPASSPRPSTSPNSNPNWPSKNGNPSGPNRGNNPPSTKK